jgi:hypothetical protein
VGYSESKVDINDAAALEFQTDVAPLELETNAAPLELETETDMSQKISKQEWYSVE